MRVFVLCAGRCGSLTLALACQHLSNYTAGHETRNRDFNGRLDYPDGHIEVDNRLSWHLGELHQRYGDEPVYVHLKRDPEAVARSYARRFNVKAGIMAAYATGIVRGRPPQTDTERLAAARAYVATVTANVELFLATRPNTLSIDIETPHPGFGDLWERIDAAGDRESAHGVLDTIHNRGRA